MKKKVLGLIAGTLLVAAPAMAQEVPQVAPAPYNCDYMPSCEVAPGIYGKMGSPATSKFNLSIGGFVKLDYAYNSSSLGNSTPAMATTQTLANARVGSDGYKQDQSIFTARQSRFWLKVAGPTFLGAKTGALIEADFYGAGGSSNENGVIRMRQAWGSLDWANTQVLFGQAYDIFGPAIESLIDFGSGMKTGAPNNPRVPQLRVTQRLNLNADNSIKLVVGLQNPSQDGVTDNGGTAGNYGPAVNVAGQVMFISKALGASPGYYGLSMNDLTIGAFGLYGNSKKIGTSSLNAYGYGVYTFVPVLRSKDRKNRTMTATLEGQAYIASGMNWNGATAAQTVPSGATDVTGAKGYGAFGQIIFYPTQNLGLTAGYGRRNAINYASYGGGSGVEEYNENIYANVAYDLNAAIRVAAEYQHMKTQFAKAESATIGDFGQANILRLAAFYFF
jgi:hypothetical protein